MRILHLAPFYKPDVGGMETFTAHLVNGLQQRGHVNMVVATHRDLELPDLSEVDGVPVHRVHYLHPLYNHDLKAVLRARHEVDRLRDEFRPDVTVLNVGGMLALLHKPDDTPLVLIVHDVTPDGSPSPTLKQLFLQADRIVTVSQARFADARIIAPEAADRMSVIHPCVPWRELHPDVERSPTPLVLMAGRADPAKGFDLAVDAFRKVQAAVPAAQLVLVGKGPVLPELKEQVSRLRLESAVRLAGYLPDAELTRLFQQAWLTLVPSRHSESFGIVALEAMQTARPVIASRTGGLQEVVADGETGLLVPVDDVDALADAMLRLIADPELARRMGQAGEKRAHTLFEWDACLAAYEAVFDAAVRS